MVGLQREFTLQLKRVGGTLQQEQAWQYLRAAEDLAKIALRLDTRNDVGSDRATDHLQEIWATETANYPLAEGGWLRGSIEDLQGRFNLNGLVEARSDGATDGPDSNVRQGEDRLTAHQRQFVRLLLALEIPDMDEGQALKLVDSIADFIDTDDAPRPLGAERDAYQRKNPPYRPANRTLTSVTELRAVIGMNDDIYQALAPYVTVWPERGGALNVLTAPATVLRSLNTETTLQPLTALDGEALVRGRTDGEWQSLDELTTETLLEAYGIDNVAGELGERSNWFLLTARVEIADTEQRLYSVIERDGDSLITRYRTMGDL
ncbi:general secretion pathway protein K [Luminiphilus syltensis NOR5-1B]|uniref:Type II secretion system protein K n=2 Tax=Luminiphilus TaxID=1341118 RepID=B8KQM1_9GAMM|nr:general secretion pathway protein K [Luminiphilus syltensis NOR5-1B]